MAEPERTEDPRQLEVRQLKTDEEIQLAVAYEKEQFGDNGMMADDFRKYVDKGNAFCLFENGNFAGVVVLTKIDPRSKPVDYPDWPSEKIAEPYVIIDELAAKPYYQSNGLGHYPREARLFQAAEQRARELACTKIFMAVPSEDEPTYSVSSYDCFRSLDYAIGPSKATWAGKVHCTLIEKSL